MKLCKKIYIIADYETLISNIVDLEIKREIDHTYSDLITDTIQTQDIVSTIQDHFWDIKEYPWWI